MADRMARLLVELVRRDLDYGRFCHEEFYTDEIAGYLQQGKEYEVCIDFVRMMIKKHDAREREHEIQMADEKSEAGPEQGHRSAPPGSATSTAEAGGGGG